MKTEAKCNQHQVTINRLIEDLLGRAHGGLDVQHLDVLPVLLQQRHQEVDGKLHVQGDITSGHGHVGNAQGHAHDLLHLELDGSLGGLDLLGQGVVLIEHGRELAGLGEARTQDTRDLLDQGGRSKEVVVLLGELLDELLVLVELLQVINGHLVNAHLISTLTVLLVAQNADGRVWLGDDGKSESSGETFVSGRIIVLQGDLELYGFNELADLALLVLSLHLDGLSLGELKDVLHAGR
jgi:hypothetical protein